MGLLKTYLYARSEMGRAILEAGQFAHVPENTVWNTLDDISWPCCDDVSVTTKSGHRCKEKGFFALDTLDEFAVRFGTLCPVCLTPVGFEPRSTTWVELDYMPTWLPYHGDNRYPELAIKEEPDWYEEAWNNRSCPGMGAKGRAHARCGIVDRVAHNLERGDKEASLEPVIHFFRRRNGGFKAYLEWLRDRPRPSLRFNPRKHREPRHYSDLRWTIDTVSEAA